MIETEILALVFLNGIVDTILGLAIGVFVVARFAVRGWKNWLMSKESEPYMDRVAVRVIAKLPPYPVIPKVPSIEDFMEALEPRISGLEERVNQPIELDLDPMIVKLTQNITAEVDKIRAVIDGKTGWMKKVEKQTDEVIAQEGAQIIMESRGLSPGQRRLYTRFKAMLADEKWTKANPAAAAGLDALVAEFEQGEGGMNFTGGSPPSSTGGLLRRRR